MNLFFLANRTGAPLHVRHIPDHGPPRRAILIFSRKTFVVPGGDIRIIANGEEAYRFHALDAVARKEMRLVTQNFVTGATVLHARNKDDDLVVIITMKN